MIENKFWISLFVFAHSLLQYKPTQNLLATSRGIISNKSKPKLISLAFIPATVSN